jgi:hypothetical protein
METIARLYEKLAEFAERRLLTRRSNEPEWL